ncbi:AAA family ATPase, partial [Chloroflexota bacterium]
MQLNEIHIDGFGIFNDRHITGLSSGINVVYGPNEFGKSTILAFIRQMLFGFPSPTSAKAYPVLSGGEYGGRLVCKLADGEIVTISRQAGRSGGPVECFTDSNTLQGQSAVDTFIDQISAKLYENVYAISLEELQQTASLEDAEVRNHIYGPGLELGTKSLTEIQNTFIKRSEEIYKSSGSAQMIPKVYRDIREKERVIRETKKLLSRYDEIGIERDKLQDSIDRLENDINKLEQEQNILETQINMFPTYVLLITAQENLADTEETSDFSEDAVARLEKLDNTVVTLENQAAAEAREMDELVNSPENVPINTQIIDLETSIVILYKQSELFKKASEDIVGINADIVRGISDKNAQIERLGTNWTVEKVIGFKFDLVQEDHCRTAKTKITDSQRNIESIKTKLAAHKESKAADASRRTIVSPTFRVTGYISAALGAVGIAAGILIAQPVVSIASSILFIVGLILSFSGRGPGLSSTPDALEINYKNELTLAESDDKQVSEEWRAQLKSAGISEDITPDGALDIVRAIKGIQSDQKTTTDLEDRSNQMQEAIDSVNKLLGEIYTTLGKKQANDGTID